MRKTDMFSKKNLRQPLLSQVKVNEGLLEHTLEV